MTLAGGWIFSYDVHLWQFESCEFSDSLLLTFLRCPLVDVIWLQRGCNPKPYIFSKNLVTFVRHCFVQ